MENQTKKNMENEMETVVVEGLIRILGFPKIRDSFWGYPEHGLQ